MRTFGVWISIVASMTLSDRAHAVQELPPPSGDYAVGRTLAYFTNDDRPETWTDDPDDRRELPLFIWYPADPKAEAPEAEYLPYPSDKIRGKLAIERGRGRALTIHCRTDAPLAQADTRFPIVLFSSGAGASPASYHAIIEDLASHGYVVVGMDHPYEGAGQVMSDGRLVAPTAENLRPDGDPATEAYRIASRANYFRRISERSADAATTIKALARMNDERRNRFFDRFDLGRVGVFGHSMGGMTAAHALTDVVSIRAGVNLDGHADSMPFDAAHTPVKPFMCVEAPNAPASDEKLAEWGFTRETYEAMLRGDDERQIAAYRMNPTVSYRLTIRGAEHNSFSDETYLMPEKVGMPGTQRETYTAIARFYLLQFFDKFLRDRPATALSAVPAAYADVTSIEVFGQSVH